MYKILRNSFLLLLFLISAISNAQNTLNYIQEDRLLQKGAELYEKQMYARAQEVFAEIIAYYGNEHTDVKANAEYYSALCAIALYNRDAEDRIAEFIAKYPESPLTRWAYFEMGKFQYRKQDYEHAVYYFEKVWKQHLNQEQLAEFYFKLGYSYYKNDEFDKAQKIFYELVSKDSKYHGPGVYYYAYLAYKNGKYQTALNRFEQIKDDPTFAPIIPYYEVQIYFLQGKYDKVLSYGPQLIDSSETKREAEISRLIGEALYKNNQFAEAKEYLEKYKNKAATYTRDDIYQLGYVYYMTDDYENAASNLSDVTNADDQLTQNAYFHLAFCYLKLEKRELAMHAFKSASEYDYDTEITEQSLLNYAKLSYELSFSPFNETIVAFHNYIAKYPNSIHHDEAYGYLVKVYLTSKSYKEALDALRKIKVKSPEMLAAHQRVAYYRGLELFNNLQFEDAFKAFDESAKQRTFDKQINALAVYWRAEALYRMERYRNAAESYESFLYIPGAFSLSEYNTAYYNLGYAYFKLKEFETASKWYRKFIDKAYQVDTLKLSDALIRTADCFFMQRNYTDAIDYYSKAVILDTFDVDYAQFQKGFSYGLVKKHSEKAVTLTQLLHKKQSNYAVDALYERGRSYIMLNETQKAIADFDTLVLKYPNSSYVVKSYLQLGLLHYGIDENEKALKAYKSVVERYPGTAEVGDALLGIKNIYVDMNNVDEYFAYAKQSGGVGDVSIAEQDSLTYMAAEKVYMTAQWKLAQRLFNDYLDKFPSGKFILNASFYRGDCMYRQGDKQNAVSDFRFIVEKPKSIFTEQALVYAAEILSEQGNNAEAYKLFVQLENQAEVKSNLLTARLGQMRTAYSDSTYENAIEAGKKVLMTDKVSEEEIRETRLVMAKSYEQINMSDLAITQYRILALDVANIEGAEAKYKVAKILYSQIKIEEAKNEINDFVKIGTSHQYWLAKSFMLLSDIHKMQKNNFKAKAYLQSIISNYGSQTDGIVDEARDKLADIMREENSNFTEVEEADLAPELKPENGIETKTDSVPNQE